MNTEIYRLIGASLIAIAFAVCLFFGLSLTIAIAVSLFVIAGALIIKAIDIYFTEKEILKAMKDELKFINEQIAKHNTGKDNKEKLMVDFGNYLLSKDRDKLLLVRDNPELTKEIRSKVTDADIRNYLDKTACSQTQQGEKVRDV